MMRKHQIPPPTLEPTTFTRPFWNACKRSVLEAARCKDCGHTFLPAGPICPRCWSSALAAQTLSGKGEVVTFTVYRQSYHPGLAVPYAVALVALEEGPRFISNIVGCAPEAVRIGMAVRVRFDREGDYVLPRFVPAEEPARGKTHPQEREGPRHD